MGKVCTVCGFSNSSNLNVTFHRFPSDREILNSWCLALELDINSLRKYSYICSNHFPPGSITKISERALIRKGVIPVLTFTEDVVNDFPFPLQKAVETNTCHTEGVVETEGTETIDRSFSPSSTLTAVEMEFDDINSEWSKSRFQDSSSTSTASEAEFEMEILKQKEKLNERSVGMKPFVNPLQQTASVINQPKPRYKLLRTSLVETCQSTKPSRVLNSKDVVFENTRTFMEKIERPSNSINPSQTPVYYVSQTVDPLGNVRIFPVSSDTASEISHSIQNTSHRGRLRMQTEFRCRTCLDPFVNQLEQTSISMFCFEEKTVKEGLVRLLPEMESTLSDDDFVCAKCFLLLRSTLKFMKKCLETEQVVTKDLQNNSTSALPEIVEVEDDMEFTNTNPNYEINSNSDVDNECNEPENDDNITLDEDNDRDEDNNSAFEFDPNVEEVDYILNSMSNLSRGLEGTTTNNPKTSDLSNCVIKHMNFLPLEHAKVHDHDTVVSVGDLEPNFIFSLQQKNIRLLQNCSEFDENIFKNKRVLLLGGRTEIKCLLCDEQFNTEDNMQNHLSEVHELSKVFLMESYRYQYKPGSSNICEACGKDCGNKAFKKAHLKNCFVFPCPYCGRMFTSGKLPSHTSKEHSDPKPFKCIRCKRETVNFTSFKSHLCNALICEICGKEYLDKNSFRSHNAECNKEDVKKKCPECNERFSLSDYPDHVKTHKFPCSFCGKTFDDRNILYRHEYYQHRPKRETLCPLCGKFVRLLSKHMDTHKENKMKNVKCSLCPKSFFSKPHLSRHIKLHHMFPRIICEKCGKYCNEHNIEAHYGSEHPNDTEFKCAKCEATFTRIAFLKQHAKSHAGEIRKEPLKNPNKPKSQRDVSFVRKYNLRIKAPDTPIPCKHCLKTLKGVLNYRKHLETHLTLHRYKCRYCDITYSSPGGRLRHEKLHKNPNYKFRCGECWKIMKDQDDLNAHMALHATKPKKYQCGECLKLFCREYQLRSHLINEHIQEGDIEEAKDEMIKDALMEFAV